jgi:mannose-6-phosphate isomerase-like protein (cupin superfamily)
MDDKLGAQFVSNSETNVLDIDESMNVFEYFTKDDVDGASVVTATLDGLHSRRVNHTSEKTYFLLDGTLEVETNDRTFTMAPGDAAMIPPETHHELRGENAEFLNIISPPYDPEHEDLE